MFFLWRLIMPPRPPPAPNDICLIFPKASRELQNLPQKIPERNTHIKQNQCFFLFSKIVTKITKKSKPQKEASFYPPWRFWKIMYPPSGGLGGLKKGFKRIYLRLGRRKAYKTQRFSIVWDPPKITNIEFQKHINPQDEVVPFDFLKNQVGTRTLTEVQIGPPKSRKSIHMAPNIGTCRAKIATLKQHKKKTVCFIGCARQWGGTKRNGVG